MPRPTWSGFIRMSLVSVPVKAFTAEAPEARDISFHQLHKSCHSRIRYQKVCPIHGEVDKSEIVTAYEYAKGKYVEVDEEEKSKAKQTDDKGIVIENFIPPKEVDPMLFEGSSYYLLPDGEVGEKPYALLCHAMADENRWALAEAVLWRKNRLVLLRPLGKLLTMSILRFGAQLRESKEFSDDAPGGKSGAQELRLAKRLIAETSVEKVDWSVYEDHFRKKMAAMIDEKVEQEDVVESESEEELGEPIINLMDALKRSVGRSKRGGAKSGGRSDHTVRLPHAASRRTKPKAKKRTTRKRKAS